LDFVGRGTERVKSEDLISLILFDDNGNKMHEGMAKTINISRSGVALEYSVAMDPGSKVEMTMGLGAEVVKVGGTIRNVNPLEDDKYQVGIEFDFLTEEDLKRIGMIYPDVIK